MNKKIIAIIAVLVLAALAFVGYKTFLSPKGVEGAKEVTVNIVIEKEGIDETFTYNTDYEFLIELLEENQEELGITFEEYDFGKMITGMMGYTVDPNSEYFHIYVNGEDATTGVAEIPLNDQDTYTFELKNF
jgi:hypothetical protein